jgi:VanZ family protein
MLVKGIKQKDKTVIVLLVLIAAALVFIWGNSLESKEISSEKSALLLKTITFLMEPIFGKGNITDHLIRKLAHFMEFGLLGALLSLYATMRGRTKVQSVLNCMFFCLAAAVADEAIQLISARGSQVADVLLDFAGAALGILIVIFWKWLRLISQKTKSDKELTDRV